MDGYSGATALGQAAAEGMSGLAEMGISWSEAFFGNMQGSIGETSTLAIFIGGAVLLVTRTASWRIMLGVFLGMVFTASFLQHDWVRFEPDVRDAMVLAPCAGWFCFWYGLYGDRSSFGFNDKPRKIFGTGR